MQLKPGLLGKVSAYVDQGWFGHILGLVIHVNCEPLGRGSIVGNGEGRLDRFHGQRHVPISYRHKTLRRALFYETERTK